MATDETTELETVVKELSEEFAEVLKEVLAEYPRPYGSEPVSKEQQQAEWAVIRQDPALVMQYFVDQGATIKTAIQYAKKMEGLA